MDGCPKKIFKSCVETGLDYWINCILCKRIAEKHKQILYGFNLITAIEKDDCAFNMKVVSDKLTDNIWVGDMGAAYHMRLSISRMYNLEPGSRGIKVGSGKILKVVKAGKFKGKIIQKDGSTKIIVLNKVHFVPDMYCNLFSITSAMDD